MARDQENGKKWKGTASKDSQPSQPSTRANAAHITDENDGQVYDWYTQDTPFLKYTTSIHRSMTTTRRDEVKEKKKSSGPEELKPTQTQKSLPRSFRDHLLYESQDSWISGLTEFRVQKLAQKLFFFVAHCLPQCVQRTPLANSARDQTLNRVFFQGS